MTVAREFLVDKTTEAIHGQNQKTLAAVDTTISIVKEGNKKDVTDKYIYNYKK